MTDRNLQLYSQQTNGVTYADPLDPDFTVRFKTNSSGKSLNGLQTTNYATEIIVNDVHGITINGIGANDALSIRVRVSGSVASVDRLAEMLGAVASQLSTWASENVLVGFQPSTLPINRVS
jgi:hypothetical protein